MPAYTRTSSSHDIAAAIMAEAAARGHAALDCHYQARVYDFLDRHASGATLGGWIDCADEYDDRNSYWIMAFIWCHRYLRDWFPQDVLDDFEELAARHERGRNLMQFVAGGKGIMQEEIETNMPPAPQFVLDGFAAHESFCDLPGDFD